MNELPYDPLMGPWSAPDETLWRRVGFGGRKGSSAARRLAERERLQSKALHHLHDEDPYVPWDYPRNFL